jgi:hypothetical protein
MTDAPGYWMYETSGVLRPAVESYLSGLPMTPEHIAAIRAYLRQWMDGPWQGVHELTERVDAIRTRASLSAWLHDALDLGIDPL